LKLTTRLTLFFLATLGLVLVGFSTALYFLASSHLHQQSEERLEAALNTLAAAAEIGPEGVEWEPAARHLNLGTASFGDQVVWLVSDDKGQIVDRSKQSGPPPRSQTGVWERGEVWERGGSAEDLLAKVSQDLRTSQRLSKRLHWQGERWQCSQRWIQPAITAGLKPAPAQPEPKDDGPKYSALAITVGVSLEPARATLQQLLATLVGLSLAVWLVALFLGRAVCRRALRPVTVMAASAREMNVDDLANRLAIRSTGDELEDLSRAFNGLLERLQESFERQRRFTGDASHQLRTPLTAMLGQIEVALRRERPAEEYQQVLSTVHQRAGHLRRIVEALLFLARADNEARLPELERVQLSDWLAVHLQTWSEHERAKDIVLQCSDAGSSFALVQPALLGELVNILIENAAKYSPLGTPITVRLHQEKQAVSVQVKDQGCGIGETDLPHVFTPFFRSAETRRRGIEGSGLGLSIAKRLAEAFGGVLSVTSLLGQGSSFILWLPLVGKANESGGTPSVQPTGFTSPARGHSGAPSGQTQWRD
jgi:heavy metal sensor kinase